MARFFKVADGKNGGIYLSDEKEHLGIAYKVFRSYPTSRSKSLFLLRPLSIRDDRFYMGNDERGFEGFTADLSEGSEDSPFFLFRKNLWSYECLYARFMKKLSMGKLPKRVEKHLSNPHSFRSLYPCGEGKYILELLKVSGKKHLVYFLADTEKGTCEFLENSKSKKLRLVRNMEGTVVPGGSLRSYFPTGRKPCTSVPWKFPRTPKKRKPFC